MWRITGYGDQAPNGSGYGSGGRYGYSYADGTGYGDEEGNGIGGGEEDGEAQEDLIADQLLIEVAAALDTETGAHYASDKAGA